MDRKIERRMYIDETRARKKQGVNMSKNEYETGLRNIIRVNQTPREKQDHRKERLGMKG